MKSITEYINESFEMIKEAFECDVFKKADASIKRLEKAQNDYYKEVYGEDYKFTRKLKRMKDVFRFIHGIELSKVTNDMVSEGSPKDNAIIKRIRKIIKSDVSEICLGFIGGEIRCITSYEGITYTWPTKPNSFDRTVNYDSPQYMKLEPFKDCDTVYFIEITKEMRDEYNKKRSNRFNSRQGMIYQGDASFYLELARANRDRYRRMIEQNKAKNMEDDELIQQYKTIVEQAVEISSNVASNPEKFNDKFWQFQTLMENLYGQKVYVNHSTKGQNGIFVLFTEYVDLKRDVMKNGGYEHQSRRLNSVTDELKAKLNKVEEYIKTNFAA